MNGIVPRLGNGLANVSVHIPALSMSIISLAIGLGGTTSGRTVYTTVGTTSRNRLGNMLNCARSTIISSSFLNYTLASVFSTGTNICLASGFIGIIS